jgi:SAM-dependent methyltransferase
MFRVENSLVVGSGNKYNTKNPIGRYLLQGFDRAILSLIVKAKPKSVLEIGCGECHVTNLILGTDVSRVLATDISNELISENAARFKDLRVTFKVQDLMRLSLQDEFDLVVCTEVLEHLDDPERAIDILHSIKIRNYLFSVPCEPVWRIMNMVRGAYWSELGNSPGHLNNFSRKGFLKLLERKFVLTELRTPLPWTIVLCHCR